MCNNIDLDEETFNQCNRRNVLCSDSSKAVGVNGKISFHQNFDDEDEEVKI